MRLASVSGIVSRNAAVSYWPIFFPVPDNSLGCLGYFPFSQNFRFEFSSISSIACEAQTYFRSSLLSLRKNTPALSGLLPAANETTK